MERSSPSWPKPRAVLVITGELDGYIEPCGCTGKENQKGGLSRRQNFLRRIHGGGLGGGAGRSGRPGEPVWQADRGQVSVDRRWPPRDGLRGGRLWPGRPAAAGGGTRGGGGAVGDQPTPYVSGNVGLLGLDANITPRFRVVEAGGLKIGITSVLGDEEAAKIRNDDIEMVPAAKALGPIAAELSKAGCDHQVLLCFAKPEETQALAAKPFRSSTSWPRPAGPTSRPRLLRAHQRSAGWWNSATRACLPWRSASSTTPATPFAPSGCRSTPAGARPTT